MSLKLGIPYMGSKRQLASKIVDKILQDNPSCKYVYDLFGGGGAISFEFLQRPQIKQVYYNELNTGVVELLKKIQKYDITNDFYEWISREDFNKYKEGDDWKAGLIKTCWSFGNNQKDYIYGKDIEQYKYWFHQVVVSNIDYTKEMMDFCEKYVLNKYNITTKCNLVMPVKRDFQERRLEIRNQLRIFEKTCKTQRLEQLPQLEHLQRLKQLQHLAQLEQLERLQQPILNNLIIYNSSYEEVLIDSPMEETIIYLDPPYENTGKYQKDINHLELYNWIKNSNYKIYLSSYSAPFEEVLAINHRSTFSASVNNKSTDEKLFCNKIYI